MTSSRLTRTSTSPQKVQACGTSQSSVAVKTLPVLIAVVCASRPTSRFSLGSKDFGSDQNLAPVRVPTRALSPIPAYLYPLGV
ncbi:hypothetical protein BH09ACT8_BH09ACT8_60830 [soil metagenome]